MVEKRTLCRLQYLEIGDDKHILCSTWSHTFLFAVSMDTWRWTHSFVVNDGYE